MSNYLPSKVYNVTDAKEDRLVYLSLRGGRGVLLMREGQLDDVVATLQRAQREQYDGDIVWSTLDALSQYDDDDIAMIAAHEAVMRK